MKLRFPFSEQELAEFLFDRIIVHCPKCQDTQCIRSACQKTAEDLIRAAEVSYRDQPVADGGA